MKSVDRKQKERLIVCQKNIRFSPIVVVKKEYNLSQTTLVYVDAMLQLKLNHQRNPEVT